MIRETVLIFIAISAANGNILSDLVKIGINYNIMEESSQAVPDSALITTSEAFTNTKTVILIHGWLSNPSDSILDDLKTALAYTDSTAKIITVDWSYYSYRNYATSASYLKSIASIIAGKITQSGLTNDKIYIIGHHMGAHIAGFIAKALYPTILPTTTKISRISALDPAGPMFEYKGVNDRLDKRDAKMVDALITDKKGFGSNSNSFTATFYANYGYGSQPYCPIAFYGAGNTLSSIGHLIGCSSWRSVQLYISSLYYPLSVISCQNENAFKSKTCINPDTTLYGYTIPSYLSGSYFFTT